MKRTLNLALLLFTVLSYQPAKADHSVAASDTQAVLTHMTISPNDTGFTVTVVGRNSDSFVITDSLTDTITFKLRMYSVTPHTPITLKHYYEVYKAGEAGQDDDGDGFYRDWDYPDQFPKEMAAFSGKDSSSVYQFRQIGNHRFTSICYYDESGGCFVASYLTFVDSIRITFELSIEIEYNIREHYKHPTCDYLKTFFESFVEHILIDYK